jgi:hypothetical protein
MRKFVTSKVFALGVLLLAGAGCSRNRYYETAAPDEAAAYGAAPTVQATPAAYESVHVQSQAYATPGGPTSHGYAAPGEGQVAAADPDAAPADPNAAPPATPPDMVGVETLSDGNQVKVVTYVHTYPEAIETYPRVWWSDRWYYNVNGNFVFYSPYYGGWVYYWGPPSPLIYAWNGYYPWAPYAWGWGYYGYGYYWGGVGYYGWHAYGAVPPWYYNSYGYGYYNQYGGANRPATHGAPNAGGPSGSSRHSMNASSGGPSGSGFRPYDDKRAGAGGAGSGGMGPGREHGLPEQRRRR